MSKPITLKVTLPEHIWAEVYYAVESKISMIAKGAYSDDSEEDVEKWLADLAYAQSTLETLFQQNKIDY